MIVPLMAVASGSKLRITTNGKLEVLDFPFKPYLVMEGQNRDLHSTPIEMTRIPDGNSMTMHKVESNTVDEMEEKAKQLTIEGVTYHRVPYTSQIYSDLPEFPLQFPNTDPLKVMYLDIEVLTKGDGIFPRPRTNPVIAIGCATGDGEVTIFDKYTKGKACPDKEILTEFMRHFRSVDPDVIVTYNGISFDLPYIATRMERCKMDTSLLNRHPGRLMDRNEIVLRGRIHFDLLLPARKDQSLFGIKSKKLKDVAKWYGYDAKVFGEDIANTQKHIGSEQLRAYLKSDVEATRTVSNVYLPNAISLAEIMKVPLGAIVGCFPSFIPKLICGRHCNDLKLQPLDTNMDRYGLLDDDRTEDGRIHTLGTKYEGAIVSINKTGYFPKISKVDFSSQYPSAIRTWNLGPDTTKVTNISDYTGEYKFTRTKDKLVMVIPDGNFQKDIEVTINMSKTGFLKAEIENLAAERTRLKKLMEETTSEAEESGYNSRQMAIKIIQNSIYGYLGNRYATYGDMISALTVTGMCRWTTKIALDIIGDALIELDTDGMVVEGGIDYERINKKIEAEIREQHGCVSYMKLEEEPLMDAYFYKMKNYVLRRVKKGRVVTEKHGCAFKSSKLPPVYDSAMDEICRKMLDREIHNQYEDAENLKDLSKYTLSDFKQRSTFTKDLPSYGERVSLQRVLGLQVEHRLKQKVEKGMQIEYFVTKEPPNCKPLLDMYEKVGREKGPYYTISQYVTSVDQLDSSYYTKQMDKLFKMFEWQISPQQELDI